MQARERPTVNPETERKARPAGDVLLESGRRFSECVLWDLQRRFFQERGIAAWRSGVVPQYITSHPFLAEAYARVTMQWLREVHQSPEFNPELPVRVFELAAGSGRFAFLFLRAFSKLLEIERRCRPDFFSRPGSLRYVMTDLVEANVEFWRGHAKFAPFVEAGLLDFQCLDLDWHAGETPPQIPAPATGANPTAVIANYCFDSLRNDVFLVRDGRLFEARVDVARNPDVDADVDESGLSAANAPNTTGAAAESEGLTVTAETFAGLELRYSYHEVADARTYYQEDEFNEILREYEAQLSDAIFVFPIGALSVLRKFAALGDGRLMLLSADKGFAREEDLLRGREPDLVLHGCFSLMVNYHAVRRFFERRSGGGFFTQCAAPDASLKLVAALSGFGDAPIGTRTRAAAEEYLGRLNPEDLYLMRKQLAVHDEIAEFAEPAGSAAGQEPGDAEGAKIIRGLFARLRFGGYDSEIFFAMYAHLRDALPGADAGQKRELARIAREIWDNYFPIGESRDLAFHLGVLLHEIEFHKESLWFFERSYEGHAPDANTVYNLAVCHYELRDFEAARRYVREALTMDPDQIAARALRIKLEAEIAPL